MPELPEVQTVVNTLAPHIVGTKILRIVHLRPDIVTPPTCDLAKNLTGRTIQSIHRRAKRIVITLDDGHTFFIHLGMSGRLTLDATETPIPLHTHLILELSPRSMGVSPMHLRFKDPRRFGGIFVCADDTAHDANLGPEPLTLKPNDLAPRLAKTKRAIKNVLLDQRVIAGLGNIYVDESLHDARIHPLARADRLKPDQIRCLTASIQRVLKKAIQHRGSTLRDYVDAQGGKGAFQRLHKVYDRAGHPCPACRTPIRRIVLGGRSTCFCPVCQPRRASAKSTARHRMQ
ncbi:MAG TPA: bifunctional DNA-formamidopyrimidine glycosylase/DNA-(apurinic or apyrimidinic site) lyase [Tepidisphaeraceae bacterium]|jgi:formamidopyrimidine-DNA glycosylase